MSQADESPGKVFLQLRCAIVDQLTIFQSRIPAENATLHGNVDPDAIHIRNLCFNIEKLGMHSRIPSLHRLFPCRVNSQSPSELDRNVVMFEVDDHSALRRAKRPFSCKHHQKFVDSLLVNDTV